MDNKHFFEGMKPLPTDFDLLQKNTEDADGAIPLSLSGAGILGGLTLTKQQHNGKAEILVNHGTAVTDKGNILVVDSSITHPYNVVEITNAAANAATAYLYVFLERIYTETTTLNIRNESVWDERTYSARAVLVADNQKDVYAQGHEAVLLGRLNKATGVLDFEGVKYATGWGSLHSSLRSTLMAMVFPSHSIYVQYPHQQSPVNLYPYIEWEDITSIYDGAFFRAYKSGLSGRFSEYNNGGLLSYSLQQDAGRDIYGEVHYLPEAFNSATSPVSGVFSRLSGDASSHTVGSPDRGTLGAFDFRAGRSWGSSHTASEFRPLNHAVKIWRSKGIKADYNFAGAVGNGTSGGQGSGGQGSVDPSLFYTKAQTDHLLGYKATATALTALRGDVYDKSAIDAKFIQVSGSVPDLSGYLHVKKGAYDLNYDGEFIDMDADFNGAYNGGYGVNLTITKCKNARAVPIFGHRTCTDFAQDKSSVGNDTLLHIPVVVGTNKFWLAKKSFGFTFAIEYVGSTAPNMMNPPTAEIESKSGITGAVPVKNLGTKTYNGRTYSYFLARVDYKLDADFANPTIELVLNFDSAKISSKMEIIAYNGYVFEGLTSARYNAADLTTNFHFPANPKFDHRTFDDTTDGDTVVAGYTRDKEVRLPQNVIIEKINLGSALQKEIQFSGDVISGVDLCKLEYKNNTFTQLDPDNAFLKFVSWDATVGLLILSQETRIFGYLDFNIRFRTSAGSINAEVHFGNAAGAASAFASRLEIYFPGRDKPVIHEEGKLAGRGYFALLEGVGDDEFARVLGRMSVNGRTIQVVGGGENIVNGKFQTTNFFSAHKNVEFNAPGKKIYIYFRNVKNVLRIENDTFVSFTLHEGVTVPY